VKEQRGIPAALSFDRSHAFFQCDTLCGNYYALSSDQQLDDALIYFPVLMHLALEGCIISAQSCSTVVLDLEICAGDR